MGACEPCSLESYRVSKMVSASGKGMLSQVVRRARGSRRTNHNTCGSRDAIAYSPDVQSCRPLWTSCLRLLWRCFGLCFGLTGKESPSQIREAGSLGHFEGIFSLQSTDDMRHIRELKQEFDGGILNEWQWSERKVQAEKGGWDAHCLSGREDRFQREPAPISAPIF
jgi:hypothetical protein